MQEVQMTKVAEGGTRVGCCWLRRSMLRPYNRLNERGPLREAGATRARKDAPLAS